jgi:hypothetical protein
MKRKTSGAPTKPQRRRLADVLDAADARMDAGQRLSHEEFKRRFLGKTFTLEEVKRTVIAAQPKARRKAKARS